MLVDSKIRDLPVAALTAHHLDALGIECILEPIEAYRAVLAAHRPDLIIFNHLTASHLAEFSRRLAKMGVLTAVLLNEGILYDEEELRYNAGHFHADAHIDWYFCWNEPHRKALRASRPDAHTRIEVVGVPRFDFYRHPWSRTLYQPSQGPRRRPRILLCTNFVLAKFAELPREHADKLFAQWKDRIPLYRDYWGAIKAQFVASQRIFEYLKVLLSSGEFDVTVRPHPREFAVRYAEWMAALDPSERERVQLDAAGAITPLILDCDLEISCETCTTALESWIAGKPTVELIFNKHPMLYLAEHGQHATPCNTPEMLVPLVRQLLERAEPAELQAARQGHLAKWCHITDGNSCLRMAQFVAEAVREKQPVNWSLLTASDRRRGMKLRMLRYLGLPYHFDPLMPLKRRLSPGRYSVKHSNLEKAVTPADVRKVRVELNAVQG